MQYTSKEVYEYVCKEKNDSIVEWKKCRLSGQPFPIYQSDLEFYDKISPTFSGKKFSLKTPDICFEERERRRHARKNLRKLYANTCSLSGKQILSIYSPDKPYVVCENNIRWDISGDTSGHSIEFSNKLPFSQQFSELLKKVPIMNLNSMNVENSAYNNIILNSKNCYLCFSTGDSENCFYQTLSAWDSNCVDGYRVLHSENCYDNVDCDNCYECFYTDDTFNARDLWYCYDCSGCNHCYFCSHLTNKRYCILNKEYDKREYSKIVESFKNHSTIQKYLKQYYEMRKQDIVYNKNQNSQSCIGGNIKNSNNCVFCFDVIQCEDCKYCANIGLNVSDCYDCGGGDLFNSNHCYECVGVSNSQNVYFSYNCLNSSNMRYCLECYNTKNCFGCIGLKDKEYCIFNKQYTKEDYENAVVKVIEHMQKTGEWGYPINPMYSLFGYNETIAMDFYPLTKEEALKMGYKWSDYESPAPKVEKTVQGKDLPTQGCKTIKEKKPEILEKILNYAVMCEVSNKPFRLTRQEIEFYIKYNLPLPTKHPDFRHIERLHKRGDRNLHLSNCNKCGKTFIGTHDSNEHKNIYCDKCFTMQH